MKRLALSIFCILVAALTFAPAALSSSTQSANVDTDQSLASLTTYQDLSTTGPSVTVTTGTSAIVLINATQYASGSGNTGFVGVDVSGATTIAASDAASVQASGLGNGIRMNVVGQVAITGLTAGSMPCYSGQTR